MAETVKSSFMVTLTEEWRSQWEKSPRRNRMMSIDKSFPFDNHRKLINTLTRAQGSLLTQIRTRHIALNVYLHKIKKIELPNCGACWQRSNENNPETLTHYLFECPEHAAARCTMDTALGLRSKDLECILSSGKTVKILPNYVNRTGRLKTTFGDVFPSQR